MLKPTMCLIVFFVYVNNNLSISYLDKKKIKMGAHMCTVLQNSV